MIEPFCSVYTKSYRAQDIEREIEKPKKCIFYEASLEHFLPMEDSRLIYDPERDDAVIKEQQIKTLRSVYQVSYCCNIKKKSLVINPDKLDDDQFIAHFNHYYGKKTQPVARPLETARTINGYMRHEYLYTKKSELEETINRVAYEYFKRNYDAGKSRLFGKKQKELQQERKQDKQDKQEGVTEEDLDAEASPQKKPCREMEKVCGLCYQKIGNFTDKNEN